MCTRVPPSPLYICTKVSPPLPPLSPPTCVHVPHPLPTCMPRYHLPLPHVQVVGFSLNEVAIFIAVVCVTTVLAQTLLLSYMMSWFGYKYSIIIGLLMQAVQLTIYGIWSTKWYDQTAEHVYCTSRSPLYTVEPVSRGHCMSRSPLYTVEPVSCGHCMSRPPLYTVEPVSSGVWAGHLSIQWNLSLYLLTHTYTYLTNAHAHMHTHTGWCGWLDYSLPCPASYTRQSVPWSASTPAPSSRAWHWGSWREWGGYAMG